MKFSGIADEAGSSIDVQIKAHKELSWDDIEIRNVDGTNLTDVSDETFDDIFAKVTEAGLTVTSFASQLCNWSRPVTSDFQTDLDELKRAIPRMHRFGSKFIRIMSYPNAQDNPWPDEQWRDEVMRRISELAKIAEDGGIILAHENCSGWAGLGAEQTLYMIEKVNSPALKLIFDTGNPVSHFKDQDGRKFYNAVKHEVVHVHIKDAVRTENGCRHTWPGEGEGQVKEIIADLKQDGYQDYLSIEPHLASIIHEGTKTGEPQKAYDAYIEYGRRLIQLADEA